ncbi:hypothetical protein CYLTODRAFT_457546 [Cylindrobasidium torrendii FP15055 ss-10]|uniref:Uncharacterized protein n=1 Tax=Cylindrobasidium torrendii FP15055 ss-10 TaxID=1314674 RepID=A0A0D7B1P1_9AGAR|nr:hypothetical protein CYLTODRAFT_457546 [Cylindrobasidium torrendii FP15055 ss-10]
MEKHPGSSSLLLLVLALIVLLFAALMWCFLSSCMGVSLREIFSTMANSSTTRSRGPTRRFREDERDIWEMEYRGQAGGPGTAGYY